MSAETVVHAPWTDEQVAALRRWQWSSAVHPYTCGRRDGHPRDPEGDYGVLVPSVNGWFCRHCDYTQDWAHSFSMEMPPRVPFSLTNDGEPE